MRLFAASMAFFAAATVQCGIATVVNGVPRAGLETKSGDKPRSQAWTELRRLDVQPEFWVGP